MNFRPLLLALLCAVSPGVWAQRADFYTYGPYERRVPTPDTTLGYGLGVRHTTFREQEQVLASIARLAPERVKLVDIGKSVEGRTLRIAIVSSPENIKALEAHRKNLARLADPRSTSEAELKEITAKTPVVVWLNHTIHGNETASFETAMATLYTLAASNAPKIQAALKNAIVVLNPVFNPDGHERFTVWYNSLAVGSPEDFALEQDEPSLINGRGNHYRFDMNRDKLAQSQDETRAETAAFLQWSPQVFADLHGQPEVYFFPPNSLPVHASTDRAWVERWTSVFGKANAAAFDKFGWNYVTRETFDLFYPGYLDSFTTLSGAIGMTYETDAGGSLARRRSDGTVITLKDAALHHFEASLATITAAAENREALLKDYLAHKKAACAKPGFVALQPDPRATALASLLKGMGIEVGVLKQSQSVADAVRYGEKKSGTVALPAGALIVPLGQPQGALARAILEPDPHMEEAFVKEQLARRERNEKKGEREPKEGYEFYDITAWSLPFTYDVEAYFAESASVPVTAPFSIEAPKEVGINRKARVAYLWRFDSDEAGQLATALLLKGQKLQVATKPLVLEGSAGSWPRGTFIARVERAADAEALYTRLDTLAKKYGISVRAVDSGYGAPGLGSDSVVPVRTPAIALIAGEGVRFSGLWFYLDRTLGVPFSMVEPGRINESLLARFNVVILPEGARLGKAENEALKAWMQRGGCAIAIERAIGPLADKDLGLTTLSIVGDEPEKDGKKPERPTSLPGAIFKAQVNQEHFLGWAVGKDSLPVPVDGATFYKPGKGSNVIAFSKEPDGLRLSGWAWPNNTEKLLAGTVWAADEPTGDGHLVLFTNDPLPRPFWRGLERLLLSAILFGPQRDTP
ncbi:MAG: M14 family zinc carboxypeptidase [Armatimonas sp.]